MSKHTPGPWKLQFKECLAHIYCMGSEDFLAVFDDGGYQWGRYTEEFKRNVSRWVCYLDDDNLEILFKYLDGHLVEIGTALGTPEADARLIAAAPELLESLKELEAEMEVNYRASFPKGKWHGDIQEMVEKARAAIDKAEGK